MTWLDTFLLILFAFRVTRLIAWDEITQPPRAWLSGVPDGDYRALASFIEDCQAKGIDPWAHRDSEPPMSKRRWYLAKLLHCPWCVGFWVSVATIAAADPLVLHIGIVRAIGAAFALSAVVGLIAKNLDP